MDVAALLTPRAAKRAALRSARQRLTLARGPVGLALGAALTEPLSHTPRQWAALLLMAALPLLLLLLLARSLVMAWQDVLLWWAPRLDLPLARGSGEALLWQTLDTGATAGGSLALALAGLAALAVFTASLWIPPRQRLWRRLLWALCAVQAAAVVLASGWPGVFPLSPSAYLSTLLHAGLYLMLCLPLLLSLGLAGLKMPRAAQLGWMLVVLGYFALMLPHKMLLLALLLQHLPMVFAPVLFVFLGGVADLLVFVALLAGLSFARPRAQPAH